MLKHDSRVRWRSRGTVKFGYYKGFCRHTAKHWEKSGAKQMCWVWWDGNKRETKAPMCEVSPE